MSGKNTTTPAKQDGFKSQWGFIMAAVGSCVGMANVWRFPMLVSRYGGLTFLIPYFIFVFVISQSGMMEEFSLGRWAGYGPVACWAVSPQNSSRCFPAAIWRSRIKSPQVSRRKRWTSNACGKR